MFEIVCRIHLNIFQLLFIYNLSLFEKLATSFEKISLDSLNVVVRFFFLPLKYQHLEHLSI